MPASPLELLSVRTAGRLAALGFLAIALFQVALALGAPLGRAAWGGAYEVLPVSLRIGSAVAVAIWLLAAFVVTARAGVPIVPLPIYAARWVVWLLVVLSLLGALMNFASSSPWERFGWAPVALIQAGLCLVVALGADRTAPRASAGCPLTTPTTVRLDVVGRTSGKMHSFAVTMAVLGNEQYLVSLAGESDWVRNLRASGGKAVIRHGRQAEVHMHEVPADERATVLEAYSALLRKTSWREPPRRTSVLRGACR